jgi:chromosome segregation ATPase
MPKEKGDLEQLIAQLQQQRDELMLQLHLGKAEARDELEKLEKKWEQLKAESEAFGGDVAETLQAEWDALEKKWENLKGNEGAIRDTVEDVSEDVGAAVDLVGEELKRGYERLRKLL